MPARQGLWHKSSSNSSSVATHIRTPDSTQMQKQS